MNTLYDKNTILSKYKGETKNSVDETKNRPFICATKSLYGEAPLSIKDLNDKIEPNVTMFILPYESQGVIKYRIYCYLYSELKAFLMSSPVLFRFNEKSPDKSFPILKIQDVYIEFNYFLLLRYSAFVLVNPITIPIGSSSGVFENVYEVKPVSKTKFLQTGNINFFDLNLNKKNVDFSELDFAPGNSPPYKIELLYENDRIREREVSNSLPVIENIFYLKGVLAMCLNNSKTDAFDFQASGDGSYSKIFFSNEIRYEVEGQTLTSDVKKEFRTFERDYKKEVKIGDTKATVKKIQNVEVVMVERNGEQVLKEYIIEWKLKNVGMEYEEILGLDEEKQELMNPEFSQPGFIPDKNKEYFCEPNRKNKGFNYLHALVLGGKGREAELEEFMKTEEFKKQNEQTTENGWTSLMMAARNSKTDSSDKTVELLIPVSNANLQDKHGRTALMMAARYSNNGSSEKTVEMLIPVSNADLQQKDGWTALMIAAGNSNKDSSEKTVEMLIPVSDAKLQSKDGVTALMIATRNSSKDSSEKTVEMLIPVSNADLQSKDGLTALMIAAGNSNKDSSDKTVELLIPVSNANLQDKHGRTALMIATRNSSKDSSEKTVEMLIPVSDTNLQSKDGLTALMLAALYSNDSSSEKTVEMLIPVSDPNLQNKDGLTALMLAIIFIDRSSSEKTVEMLIPVSNLKIKNKDKKTALQIAQAINIPSVITLLRNS